MAKRCIIERVYDAKHQVRISGTVRRETDRPVPGQEIERRPSDVERDLAENLSGEERRPTVHSTRSFADEVDRARLEERDLYLVSQRKAQHSADEDRLVKMCQSVYLIAHL